MVSVCTSPALTVLSPSTVTTPKRSASCANAAVAAASAVVNAKKRMSEYVKVVKLLLQAGEFGAHSLCFYIGGVGTLVSQPAEDV